jgi:hypothetical protein
MLVYENPEHAEFIRWAVRRYLKDLLEVLPAEKRTVYEESEASQIDLSDVPEQPEFVLADSYTLPDEFYLRELTDLDTEDARAVRAFLTEWGPPTSYDQSPAESAVAALAARLDIQRAPNGPRAFDKLAGEYRNAAEHFRVRVPLDRAVTDLKTLSLLASAVALLLARVDAAEAEVGDAKIDALADFVSQELGEWLAVFHPIVQAVHRHRARLSPILFNYIEPARGVEWGHLVALQMFNHIAEGAELKTCANEDCGRFFARHRGRSTAGRHRMSEGSVNYCSKACTMTGSQRARRAAIAAGKALHEKGFTVRQIAANVGRTPEWVRRWCLPEKGKRAPRAKGGDQS